MIGKMRNRPQNDRRREKEDSGKGIEGENKEGRLA